MIPRRTDANQVAIMRAFRERGAIVFDTHVVGRGFPDLMVVWRGKVLLVEVKMPDGELTRDEIKFADLVGALYHIAVTEQDVERILADE